VVLQAHALSVEVGGRLVVDGATFTVMPRDKVGIVGRNGAGKTSLFKVLGGEAEPAAGKVVRKGGFGYLPQDPRIDSAHEGRTAITHVLSGRGIDDELMRIEKLRIAMEENPTERNVARYSRAEERSGSTAGTPPRARRVRSPPGSGSTRAGSSCRSACCRAASGAGSSSPASCSPAATCSASTSPPTTSTSTPRCGCSASCASTGARCS
jgi:energy-coupling factor transporter ATP-binding protein EcfA2